MCAGKNRNTSDPVARPSSVSRQVAGLYFSSAPQIQAKGTPASVQKQEKFPNRAERPKAHYLRAAQAYMLISMPTDTSTIFGAFQVIPTSMDFSAFNAERN
jgi:hypothetical protein